MPIIPGNKAVDKRRRIEKREAEENETELLKCPPVTPVFF
jgi:tmRNA-binding protein